MKKCKKCNIEKELSEYYVHDRMLDGHLNICKDCTKKRIKKHREENILRIQEYDRFRHRIENMTSEQWKRRRALSKLWDSKNKDKCRTCSKNWTKNNKLKKMASTMVNNAIRDKRLTKPKECSFCGTKGRIHGHHEDYYKPLEVVWLCSLCHRKIHRS